jgi:hypothetical protein
MSLNYVAPRTIGNFMASDKFVRLMVGPVGSGKSMGAIMEMLRRSCEQAPNAQGIRKTRWAIVRNTLPQIKQTCLADIQQYISPICNYRLSDSTIHVSMKDDTYGKIESEWLMIPLDSKEDQQRLLSLNLTGAWVSEFREIPISIIDALAGRVGRYPSKAIVPPTWWGIIGESNPPDEDSDWYQKLEIETPPNWGVFKQPGGLDPMAENKENLPPDYYENLVANNTPDWVDVHVHANYGKSLSGQAVFRSTFRPEWHVVYGGLSPSTMTPLMVAQDFGRTPAALICQVDAYGRLLVFREITSADMGIEKFAAEYLRPTLLRCYPGASAFVIADPAGRDKNQTNEVSPFDALRKARFSVYAAPTNQIEPRLRAVEEYFMRASQGGPALIIDGGNCPQLVLALKSKYRYKRRQTGDLDDKPEKTHPWSDLADCLQYAALGSQGNYTAKAIRDSNPRPRANRPSVSSWT